MNVLMHCVYFPPEVGGHPVTLSGNGIAQKPSVPCQRKNHHFGELVDMRIPPWERSKFSKTGGSNDYNRTELCQWYELGPLIEP